MVKRIAISLTLASLLVACGSRSDEPASLVETETEQQTAPMRENRVVRQRDTSPPLAVESVTQPITSSATRDIDPTRQLPRVQGQREDEGFGLSIMLDGSSPQAFLDSLELVAEDSSSAQIRALHSSLEYLRLYSLGHPDLASFYKSIDGMTGEEIISKANERRRSRR